jgi:heme exporter protein D
MGRHGFYVWLAYGLSALIIIYNVVAPLLRRNKLIKEQTQRLRRERGRRPAVTRADQHNPEENNAPSA